MLDGDELSAVVRAREPAGAADEHVVAEEVERELAVAVGGDANRGVGGDDRHDRAGVDRKCFGRRRDRRRRLRDLRRSRLRDLRRSRLRGCRRRWCAASEEQGGAEDPRAGHGLRVYRRTGASTLWHARATRGALS